MSGIIWLASYPKSGNTWLRAFLANYLSDSPEAVPINALPKFIYGDSHIPHYQQLTGRPLEELSEEELAVLRGRVHLWLARAKPHEVFVKTHSAMGRVGGAPAITPDATAGAIYVIRNPCDVAVSFAHHYQVSVSRAVALMCDDDNMLPASGGQLAQFLSSWRRHVLGWTEAKGLTLHLMRYEDMLRAPEATFAKLVAFLGFPPEPERLERALRFSSFRELSGQEQTGGFVEARPDGKSAFFRAGESGQHHQMLADADRQHLIETNRDVLSKYGYLDDKGALVF